VVRSLDALITQGDGAQPAIDVGHGIFMSKNIANSYLLTSRDGDMLINAGTDFEAPQIKQRFAEISDGPLRAIVFTQGHPDHVGGWSLFNSDGVETIAQANHPDVREYWRNLHPFYVRRIARLWGQVMDVDALGAELPPEPVLTTSFIDSHSFDLGGRRFELYSTPGGETTDALVVWLPAERTVFIGNLLGPFFGHVPNLYTLRGDKIRSAIACIHSVHRVIDLEPETLINGHDVFRGADEIRRTLSRVRDGIAYLRDATIAGMNAGKDLWTLMRTVTLPPELMMGQAHGRIPWLVRAIFEEHTGWFRYESTTELYDVPPSQIWSDVVELAGGPSALAERARRHLDEDRPLHALHLADIALSQQPDDPDALRVKRDGLTKLLHASGGENFSETRWLEQELRTTTQSIEERE
jgi:glyoxylase-like metal-dependent hydrolase (beta-lactamase superfamily II)